MKFCVCNDISEEDVGLTRCQHIEARKFKELYLEASNGKPPHKDCGACYRSIAPKLRHIEHH